MAEAARALPSLQSLSGAQRAAILVMYLDRPVARQMLEHLDTREIEEIGRAMADVEYVEPELVEQVVGEFVRDLWKGSMVPRTGRDFALDILPDLVDEKRRMKVHSNLRRSISTDFQDYISSRPARTIAALLQDEHPQTQAVALLMMGADNAARVLAELDEQDQYDLSVRMARIDGVPSDLADDVEASVRGALEAQGSERWIVQGVDRTAQVLGRLGRPVNEPLLDKIADEDRGLSDTLRRRMVTFKEIAGIDDRGIQSLLKAVDRQTLLVALRGAEPPAREAFLKNMSQRAAADLREEIELMGPTPKSQISLAQEEIVQVALRLSEEGNLRLNVGGGDDALV